jgi:hypothetical protein
VRVRAHGTEWQPSFVLKIIRRAIVAETKAAAAAFGPRQGRSIQANVGVEFKGVSWR